MIFNSLGSNYSAKLARQLRWQKGTARDREEWTASLTEYFGAGPVALFYKGREALRVGLELLALPEKKRGVAITAFTCSAVEEAVRWADYQPVFVDLDLADLNFNLKTLRTAHKKHPELGAVVLQNTFGYQMTDLVAVINYCRDKGLKIIEDGAHSFGLHYQVPNRTLAGQWGTAGGPNGPKMGTIGDLAILSFSQDKGLDVVSGGALIANEPGLAKKLTQYLEQANQLDENGRPLLPEMKEKQQQIDRRYPARTRRVRGWYPVLGLGKVYHWHLKKQHLLASPLHYQGEGEVWQMNDWAAAVAQRNWQQPEWRQDLAHRRQIAKIYWLYLGENFAWPNITPEKIEYGSCLRWPVKLMNQKQRRRVIKYLQKKGVEISDVWYESVIAPVKKMADSSYKMGECPQAEQATEMILNLPTHRAVSADKARQIAWWFLEALAE